MAEPNIHRCCHRGCTTKCNTQCAAVGCDRWICENCYAEQILNKYDLYALPCPNDVETVVCTKKCHQRATKAILGEGRQGWGTDTPTGDFAQSSDALLIDWLLVHGNYDTWKGNNKGITKRELQKEIADFLNKKGAEMGIQRRRTEGQVGSKISYWENKFRDTTKWIENTAKIIRDRFGEETFAGDCQKGTFQLFLCLAINHVQTSLHGHCGARSRSP